MAALASGWRPGGCTRPVSKIRVKTCHIAISYGFLGWQRSVFAAGIVLGPVTLGTV
jgi:hypothetical protein